MFDKVVIRQQTTQANNIHLAVHPFRSPTLYMMTHTDSYDDGRYKPPMPQYMRDLADKLWLLVPGLQTLFFDNGRITVQHVGLFEDSEIIEAITPTIRAVLETSLTLDLMS